MKALVFHNGFYWVVSIEPQFADEPSGVHILALRDSAANKNVVVAAAADMVAKLSKAATPPTLSDQRHWRVAGPRMWRFIGGVSRIV
jgi:hypothetical protein